MFPGACWSKCPVAPGSCSGWVERKEKRERESLAQIYTGEPQRCAAVIVVRTCFCWPPFKCPCSSSSIGFVVLHTCMCLRRFLIFHGWFNDGKINFKFFALELREDWPKEVTPTVKEQ